MKAIPALIIALCLSVSGCSREAPIEDGTVSEPSATTGSEPNRPGAGIVGTTWTGYISHQNAEGAATRFTWQFQPNGVLLHVRAWDDNRQTGTWRVEDIALVVKIGDYGEPGQYGTIDLERTGDSMKGETRWRSGYGFGWEFELERET